MSYAEILFVAGLTVLIISIIGLVSSVLRTMLVWPRLNQTPESYRKQVWGGIWACVYFVVTMGVSLAYIGWVARTI